MPVDAVRADHATLRDGVALAFHRLSESRVRVVLLGFFFLPTTTVAYAVAQNEFDGVHGWGLAVMIAGVVIDFGLLGGGGRAIGKRAGD